MKVKKLLYVLLVALIVFLSIGYFMYPLLGPDSGFYLANAREMYSGKVYFLDIAIAYNPLAIAILGIPFLFSNHPDPRFSLLINMLFIWAAAFVFYAILQKIHTSKKDNLFYALFFVLGCLMLDGSQLMLEPISVFFQLSGLFLYLMNKESKKNSLLILAGFAFALSFLSKQYGLFVLAPIGIDIILNKGNIIKKIALLKIGFLIPIFLFYGYLCSHGVGLIDFLKHILGVGAKLEIGNGTGINYTLVTYVTGFAVFVVFNFYVLLLPNLFFKSRTKLIFKNTLALTILPFSLLVLVSASYAHYFVYVLPYALLAFVYLNHLKEQENRFASIAILISLLFITMVSVYSFNGKHHKMYIQRTTYKTLSSAIPKNSKVYFDGVSPAFYYLCDFQSIQLNKLGYTFPGYFYQKTIVNAMVSNSYLVVSKEAFPSYRSLVIGFETKEININQQLFYIIKKQ